MCQNNDRIPRIGLALSGGGSRAIAFHLGCLRALHCLGILQKISVLSTVSGGSIIGALYATTDKSFDDFEKDIRKLLKRGLIWPMICTCCCTLEGLKTVICWLIITLFNVISISLSSVAWPFCFLLRLVNCKHWHFTDLYALFRKFVHIRRFASRTTILYRTLDKEVFKGRRLCDTPKGVPQIILNATELRTGTVFYFGSTKSGGWRFGTLTTKDIKLAYAVTASAAHPLFFPALDEQFDFRRDGTRCNTRVILSDGGIYDNIGLAPLWPKRNPYVSLMAEKETDYFALDPAERDPDMSLMTEDTEVIICCNAGDGQRCDPPMQSFVFTFKSVFSTVHDHAQNFAMKRLFDLKSSGRLKAFVLPYLGLNDDRIKNFPLADLMTVTKSEIHSYPTNFFAMEDHWIEKLSKRGEQITRILVDKHAPCLRN